MLGVWLLKLASTTSRRRAVLGACCKSRSSGAQVSSGRKRTSLGLFHPEGGESLPQRSPQLSGLSFPKMVGVTPMPSRQLSCCTGFDRIMTSGMLRRRRRGVTWLRVSEILSRAVRNPSFECPQDYQNIVEAYKLISGHDTGGVEAEPLRPASLIPRLPVSFSRATWAFRCSGLV